MAGVEDSLCEELVPEGGLDPYVQQSGALRNRFGLTDPGDIKDAEAAALQYRSPEAMNFLKAQTRFTFDVWKQVHRILFQDLYDWAGEPRSINMGREGKIVFNTAAEIPGESAAVLDRVERSADFATDMGAFYAEMNFQHPFREGNGRTLKLLFSAIAFRRGLLLDLGPAEPGRIHGGARPLAANPRRHPHPGGAHGLRQAGSPGRHVLTGSAMASRRLLPHP
ncbi:Fic family protein [Skermanella mucosa]|uniref:Fic/DOC family protein n=1 Tax=Skermanella mucosa TaxID=1789672 RepID=UPI00192A70E6|nr:Fic family protein [Skermanella mucosa]UEM22154.1 Fic family protein [Skermanella mucosa]